MPSPVERATFDVVDDSLGLMAAEATDLLGRVDLVIEHLGTPSRHRLPALLTSLRVRPGEALRMLLAVSPGGLTATVAELRRLARAYQDDLVGSLEHDAQRLDWSGPGYHAFTAYWDDQLRHFAAGDDAGTGADSMAGRLVDTADYVESIAGWFSQTRQAMAGALVEVFGSREAVTLKGCDALEREPGALGRAAVTGELGDSDRLVRAAAEIGARTLGAVAELYDAGVESFVAGVDGVPAGGWATKLAALPDPTASGAGPDTGFADKVWIRL